MTTRATRMFAVLVTTVALAIPAGASAKAPSPAKQAKQAFGFLMSDTRHAPKRVLKKKRRVKLLKVVRRARKHSNKKRVCKALKVLKGYKLKWVKLRKIPGDVPGLGSYRGQLRSDLLQVRIALLQNARAKHCGGGKRSTVTHADVKVLSSSKKRLKLRLKLPPPKFVAQQKGKAEYQQLVMNGMGETSGVGNPGLPTDGKFFGVPLGATVHVHVGNKQGYTVPGVNLYPHQPEAKDAPLAPGAPDKSLYQNQPFTKNGKAYKSNKSFPAKVATGGAVGFLRDLRLGSLTFTGGVYKPRSKKLKVFTSLDVTLDFSGGTGKFGNADDISDPWNARFLQAYRAQIANLGTVGGNLSTGPVRPFCGEEMLIVTSPALQPAADTFATHRQAAGISTRVVLTGPAAGGGIGTTNAQIRSFIAGQLNTAKCRVHPTYVVLLGNTAQVPTFSVECSPGKGFFPNPKKPKEFCDIASDLPYSLAKGNDLFADTMLGRIPAPDLATATAVVDKITNYEDSLPAPAGDDFYNHATVTGYFQPSSPCVLNSGASGTPNCDPANGAVNGHYAIDYSNTTDTRGFTKTSDKVLNAMKAKGFDVDRLWTTDNSKVKPQYYYDGTPIPNSLRRPSFGWNADTSDFLNAYNGGRFLIFHRDHGWQDGWANPQLDSGNVASMNNGSKLPVVFGVNCESARFDDPAHPSFVELQLEKASGGAVAGFGDTRVSPTWPNNDMALGFFDALFPNTVQGFGSSTPSRRLGDVLLSGKAYMASVWNGDDEYVEHYLYHLLGDPSMQMWAKTPLRFDVSKVTATTVRDPSPAPGKPFYHVVVTLPKGPGDPPPQGTIVTLFNPQGYAFGRALVGADGTATITPDDPNESPRALHVGFEKIGALPAVQSVK